MPLLVLAVRLIEASVPGTGTPPPSGVITAWSPVLISLTTEALTPVLTTSSLLMTVIDGLAAADPPLPLPPPGLPPPPALSLPPPPPLPLPPPSVSCWPTVYPTVVA